MHSESAGALFDEFGDASIADDPECFPTEADAFPSERLYPVFPCAGADVAIGFGDAAGHVEDQSHGVIGGGFGKSGRGVRRNDVALPQRHEVEVVDSHGGVGDHFQVRRGGDEFAVDFEFALGNNAGAVAEELEGLLPGGGGIAMVRHHQFGNPVERSEMVLRDVQGKEHFGQRFSHGQEGSDHELFHNWI